MEHGIFPLGLKKKVFWFWFGCLIRTLIHAAQLQRWINQPVVTWKREDAYSRVPSPPRQMMRSMQSEISSKPVNREKHLCAQVSRSRRGVRGKASPRLRCSFTAAEDLTVSYSFQSFFIGNMANRACGDVALTDINQNQNHNPCSIFHHVYSFIMFTPYECQNDWWEANSRKFNTNLKIKKNAFVIAIVSPPYKRTKIKTDATLKKKHTKILF